jgi:hypothetical protein
VKFNRDIYECKNFFYETDRIKKLLMQSYRDIASQGDVIKTGVYPAMSTLKRALTGLGGPTPTYMAKHTKELGLPFKHV